MMYDSDSFRISASLPLIPLIIPAVIFLLCSSPSSSLVENLNVLEKPASIAVENSE